MPIQSHSWHGLIVAILDVLVQQATQQAPITYKQLGQKVGWSYRALGKPLGTINLLLYVLGKAWGESIPPISVLVVSAKDGLPRPGFDEFLNPAPGTPRAQLIKQTQEDVYSYTKWGQVQQAVQ